MSDPFLLYLARPTRQRYTQLVLAYAGPVERLVRRLVPSAAADDIIQETFLALGATKKKRDEIRNPRSFVLQTAVQLARNHKRASATRARHEEEAGRSRPRSYPSASEEAAGREAVHRLHEAIGSLPPQLRLAVHLHAIEGLTYAEIADVAGGSVGSVRGRIYRARRRLQTLLGQGQLGLALATIERLGPESTLRLLYAEPFPGDLLALDGAAPKPGAALGGKAFLAGLGLICALLLAQALSRPGGGAPSGQTRPITQAGQAPHRERILLEPPLAGWGSRPRLARDRGQARLQEPFRPPADPARIREAFFRTNSREREGGMNMDFKVAGLAPVLVSLGLGSGAGAVEPGDFDEDGLITLRDVIWLEDYIWDAPERLSAAALEPFLSYPCFDTDWGPATSNHIAGSVFFESLRRSVRGSLPTWSFAHWPESWLEEQPQEPLREDPRLRVRVLDVAGGRSDDVNVELLIEVLEPVRGFILVLEGAEDVLRVPWLVPDHPFFHDWSRTSYGDLSIMNRIPQGEGDAQVRAPEFAYLITGGKFVITRGLEGPYGRLPEVQPGEHLVVVPGRLARGARAGSYPLRLGAASQVLFADGSLGRPGMADEGTITLSEDVVEGWDGRAPPLSFDVKERKVLGRVEFRLTNEDGIQAAPGEPLLEVRPGETFTLRVQARTETPLNWLHFELGWPLDVFACDEFDAVPLFEDRRTGQPYTQGWLGGMYCNWGHGGPARFGALFYCGSNWGEAVKHLASYHDRPMEYFEPLGEWLDLYEITLLVPPATPEGTVPIRFRPWDPHSPYDGRFADPPAEFAPYRAWYYCKESNWESPWPPEALWKYDVRYEDATILIAGDSTEPPLDLGIRFAIGEVTGGPGEVVDVPVLASADRDLHLLGLAFAVDPEKATVEAIRTQLYGRERYFWHTFEPPGGSVHDCLPPEVCPDLPGRCCVATTPFLTHFREGENGWVVEWSGGDSPFQEGPYPGFEPFEVARIVIRLSEDLEPDEEVLVEPARVHLDHYGFPEDLESGGVGDFFDRAHPFSPATEVRPGRILVNGGARFVRGDANADGRVDLSDAVHTLSYLFAGSSSPACLRAADADDDDLVLITDAIFLLGTLFLGEGRIPLPHPFCGTDSTEKELSCDAFPPCR